jgi:GT2 family glycosyltransferase/glycosyltransferase involved in cell wall biosynthesis
MRSLLLRIIERVYHATPLPLAVKRRARDAAFRRAGWFFSSLPAYHRWYNQGKEPSASGAQSTHAARALDTQLTDDALWGLCGRFPDIQAPSDNEWYLLAVERARPNNSSRARALVDVVIPVYDGYGETLRAIYNAIIARNETPHEIIVINDRGPNEALNEQLRRLSSQGLFTLITNETNLGFVKTVNRGFSLHSDRDVLILNADALVFGDYLDRLRNHALKSNIATVTPLTNNGEICSYPLLCRNNSWSLEIGDEELDGLSAKVNEGLTVEIPTGVGFCMYITRESLSKVGPFDDEAFGKGYGEENDFCVRATNAGFIHKLAGDVFVRHAGGVSFSERKLKAIERAIRVMEQLHPGYNQEIQNYLAAEPAALLRRNLDLARLLAGSPSQPAVLKVFHTWGGGADKHVRDLAKWLDEEGVAVFTLKPVVNNPEYCEIGGVGDKESRFLPNLRFHYSEVAELADALQRLQVAHIHIHHLVGYSNEFYKALPSVAKNLGIAFDVSVHDYFSFCPRIFLLNETGKYCGEPEVETCNSCVRKNGSSADVTNVGAWRAMHAAFLSKARRIFVPDRDVAARLRLYFPALEFTVKPHPESWRSGLHVVKQLQGDKRVVALFGAFYELKGAKVLKALIQDAHERELPLEFHLIGFYAVADPEIYTFPNFRYTGKYNEESVGELIATSGADIALFLSLWPETFSYTLSLAFQYGLYPVSFDLGAPANRIRDSKWGELWPLSLAAEPAKMNDLLLAMRPPARPEELALWRKEKAYPSLLEDYYELRLRGAEVCRSNVSS